jgi:hypothetical protein
MQNFASINGKGDFVLRLNNQVVQTISFTSENREAIQFDFPSIQRNPRFSNLFLPGRSLNVSISLENFVANQGENKDFRVNYAFSFNYFDQLPISASRVLGFNVT